MDPVRQEFQDVATELIKDAWRMRYNPMSGQANYPDKITEFISVEIDGRDLKFAISIREIVPPPPKYGLTMRVSYE